MAAGVMVNPIGLANPALRAIPHRNHARKRTEWLIGYATAQLVLPCDLAGASFNGGAVPTATRQCGARTSHNESHMTTTTKRQSHPMLLAAGMALILFCAVGISAIMGWIPNSIGHTVDTPTVALEQPVVVAEKPKSAQTKKVVKPVHVASMAPAVKAVCASCGVIESVRNVETRGDGSGVGAVGGAVVGGLLGNQVGGGNGKKAMTVVGAIGGALAGNQIEKSMKSTTSYEIVVRMENGSNQIIHEANQPAWRNGDHVKIVDGIIRSA
jgi:outer membrane lipoprotein SlyB